MRLSHPIPATILPRYLVYNARILGLTRLSTSTSIQRTCSLPYVSSSSTWMNITLTSFLYILINVHIRYKTRIFVIVSEVHVQSTCWYLYLKISIVSLTPTYVLYTLLKYFQFRTEINLCYLKRRYNPEKLMYVADVCGVTITTAARLTLIDNNLISWILKLKSISEFVIYTLMNSTTDSTKKYNCNRFILY